MKMIKKTALVFSWFVLTFLMLILSIISFSQVSLVKSQWGGKVLGEARLSGNNYTLFASLPPVTGRVAAEVKTSDARAEILRQYLTYRNSPLASFSDLIVSLSQENDIDFRLPVAIAECESNLCQEGKYPENSFNCWGYGIHSQGTLKFTSFEEGIKRVVTGLKKFKDRGYLTSVEKLMELYTPPSIEKGGSWAKCVSHFMDKLQ